jgi:hypothetical protein
MSRPSPTLLGAAFAGALLAGGAAAQQADCALTYATFEYSVPHTDLEACPPSLEAAEGTFCRGALLTETVTVFVFDEQGDQCLVASRAYAPGEYTLSVD